jgi:hypothetical protein
MIYSGDPKGYNTTDLETARRIRAMTESKEKAAAVRGFEKATGRMFPILEPGAHMAPNPNPLPYLNHVDPKIINRLLSGEKIYSRGERDFYEKI